MNIYVGNLPLGFTECELRCEFIPFGVVLSVIIMNQQCIGSNPRNGYGFVEMASESEAKVAVKKLNGRIMEGKTINVIEALPLSKDGNKDSNITASRFNRIDSVRRYQIMRQKQNDSRIKHASHQS